MFRPMLASPVNFDLLRFPVLASPKMDGVRAIVKDGRLLSRTLKPIPNVQVREKFERPEFEGFDGELIYGSPTIETVYHDTVSTVMSYDMPADDVLFLVFDLHNSNRDYGNRYMDLAAKAPKDMLWEHIVINNQDDVETTAAQWVDAGYEGAILRDPLAPYKHGRSTAKEGWMLKVKNFLDDEAVVMGLVELQHNNNVAFKDERGLTKRTTHQDNKVGGDTMGALRTVWRGRELYIGTGFTQEERQHIWNNPLRYVGKNVRFKYFNIGMKDVPRHPVFTGWRDSIDIGVPRCPENSTTG